MHPRFREFAVTGMKIEIIPACRDVVPTNATPARTPNMLENFNIFDDINMVDNFVPPGYEARFKNESFKILDPRKSHTIYRDGK